MKSIASLAFAPDAGTVQSGDLTFDLSGFSGQLEVQIDANDDGDYDDPEDLTIPYFADGGAESVAFDGLDGLGNPIAYTQPIGARIVIEAWRRHYNTKRPHSSLGYRPPASEVVQWPAPPSGPIPPLATRPR